MNKILIVISIMLITLQFSLAEVNIQSVGIKPVNVAATTISPVYIKPINISKPAISVSSYNPVLLINRVNISSLSVTSSRINQQNQIKRVYVNYYNPYKLLKNSYQNIKISYFDSHLNDFKAY